MKSIMQMWISNFWEGVYEIKCALSTLLIVMIYD